MSMGQIFGLIAVISSIYAYVEYMTEEKTGGIWERVCRNFVECFMGLTFLFLIVGGIISPFISAPSDEKPNYGDAESDFCAVEPLRC
jgi:hypothetical protein